MSNTLRIAGRLIELAPMRYTPAGVPLVSFVLEHTSRQIENEVERDVTCELQALALGDVAKTLHSVSPGWKIEATGFIAAKNKRSRMPVLHVTNIKFLEGIENGFQTEKAR